MICYRFQNKGRRRHSQLPLAWKLLHGAKKISRQVSLALTLAGMVIISLISLGQPWMHFQVPLAPPGHPDGSLTIHINTIFFMHCPDIYCVQEYDQNACKACSILTIPGIHLSFSSQGPFSAFPGMVLTALG